MSTKNQDNDALMTVSALSGKTIVNAVYSSFLQRQTWRLRSGSMMPPSWRIKRGLEPKMKHLSKLGKQE